MPRPRIIVESTIFQNPIWVKNGLCPFRCPERNLEFFLWGWYLGVWLATFLFRLSFVMTYDLLTSDFRLSSFIIFSLYAWQLCIWNVTKFCWLWGRQNGFGPSWTTLYICSGAGTPLYICPDVCTLSMPLSVKLRGGRTNLSKKNAYVLVLLMGKNWHNLV